MNNRLLYCNPVSGAIEFADEWYKPEKIYRYLRDVNGVPLKDPTEFAADAQLGLLRIADPIMTSLVQGFTNTSMIGDKLFTPVKMAKETGRFPCFGKEAFVIPTNLKRAIGERVQHIQMESGYITMSLSEYSLGSGIENRERNEWAGSPEMLLNGKMNTVAGKIALAREKAQAILATTYSNYASGCYSSGAGKKWASTGDPIKDMRDLCWKVLSNVGRWPNKAWFSAAAWQLIIQNGAILNLIKYGASPANPAQVTPQAIAQLLEVEEVLVAKSIYGTPSANGSDGGVNKSALTTAFLWDSVQSSNAGVMVVGSGGGIEPAFGYTWERMNSPIVETYYENQTKTQWYEEEHFLDPAVTLNEAGAMYYSIA